MLRPRSKWSNDWRVIASGSISGTTNSALAFTEISEEPPSQLAAIPQLTARTRSLRSPCCPPSSTFRASAIFLRVLSRCPGTHSRRYVAGKLAQRRGAEISSRLVSSAKSWLSYSSVDRTAAMLPWKAGEGVARISPVDASSEYLKHLRAAWDNEHPDAPFDEQEVLVTVPASFDTIARELTQRAAEAAGYRNLTMLEEPQAAFYAWIERHHDWRQRVSKAIWCSSSISAAGLPISRYRRHRAERGTSARACRGRRAHSAGRG